MQKRKKVVVIGGGTGSFTVLSGLKKYKNLDLTSIVSMADDGGSTGVLRDEYGVLPPGDIRQCLVALSEADYVTRDLFGFRFSSGSLRGHNFGNIFISALEKMTGDFNVSLRSISKVLKVRGRVLPVTFDNVHLVAELKNGKKLLGQSAIADCRSFCYEIKKIYFNKIAKANPEALLAIQDADLIVVGPGSFYSSLAPNFLVRGISEAVIKARAKKIFICNLMNQFGQTDNFTVSDFVTAMENFILSGVFHHVLYNTKLPPRSLLKKYSDEGYPVLSPFDLATDKRYYRLIGVNLISDSVPKIVKGDPIKRTLIRHDPDKLAKAIVSLLK
ncbi:MAG: YvcK family protein [Candidatus Vogelbacteria bacterium]|nr:YvcK family protein [Candidatus Vogelbacteria bacterium]